MNQNNLSIYFGKSSENCLELMVVFGLVMIVQLVHLGEDVPGTKAEVYQVQKGQLVPGTSGSPSIETSSH